MELMLQLYTVLYIFQLAKTYTVLSTCVIQYLQQH